MEPFLLGLLVFMTVFVGTLALFRRAPEGEAIAARLQAIEQLRTPRAMTLTLPFYRRALLPFGKSVVQPIIRLLPPKSVAAVQANLAKAGRRHADPILWMMLKWLRAGMLGGAAYVLAGLRHWPLVRPVVLGLAGAGMGYLWPERSIRRAILRRQNLIIKELPEALDLLTISVEAGLGPEPALEIVARRRPGPLSEEIRT